MAEFLYRVGVLFRKEVRIILKDPRSRFILVFPIVVQSLLFGYVASFDLNKVYYALLDEDKSAASRDLAARFDGSGIFIRAATLESSSKIAGQLDNKEALLVLHIGPHFESRLLAGRSVPVQVAVDGRNGNMAGIASSYASEIIADFNRDRMKRQGFAVENINISFRAWFNPNLESRWNIISGMLAVLSMIQVLLLTSLSVAREKEQGTFDQLLVTPLGPLAIMLGKALPSVTIGLAQSSLVLLIALYWFKIPFAGSYAALYVSLMVFNCAVVGVGLCVSALTETMQQAMLYSFSMIIPLILLSGFVTPISSMPTAVRLATYLNPARYGIALCQRIYLEGAGFAEFYSDFCPLLLMGMVTLWGASRMFRRHLARG